MPAAGVAETLRAMMFDRILVPLDFSSPADRALPVAQALAHKLVARLDAVVVTSRGLDRAIDDNEARRHARSVGCELDGVELRTEDDVVEAILAAAGSPRTLLCIATHARGAAADLALRSAGEQVLRHTTQPVLAVGPRTVVDPPPRLDEIVSCVDDDPRQAHRLLSVTADWAHELRRDPWLVRVIDPGIDTPASGSPDPTLLDELTRELLEHGVAATWEAVPEADPATGILRFASKLAGPMLIMASHGRSGLRRLVLGSVTLDVLRRSPHPVLVVPADEASPDPGAR